MIHFSFTSEGVWDTEGWEECALEVERIGYVLCMAICTTDEKQGYNRAASS